VTSLAGYKTTLSTIALPSLATWTVQRVDPTGDNHIVQKHHLP
jgi:hypothetical protein